MSRIHGTPTTPNVHEVGTPIVALAPGHRDRGRQAVTVVPGSAPTVTGDDLAGVIAPDGGRGQRPPELLLMRGAAQRDEGAVTVVPTLAPG